MTLEEIRQIATRRPFKPFTMHLDDGAQWHVAERDYILLPPFGRAIMAYKKAANPEGFSGLMVDVDHVSRVIFDDPSTILSES